MNPNTPSIISQLKAAFPGSEWEAFANMLHRAQQALGSAGAQATFAEVADAAAAGGATDKDFNNT